MIAKKKSRYVLLELSKALDISTGPAYNDFARNIAKGIGMLDFSSMNPYPIKRISDNVFIFKVSRGYEKKFILAAAFISQLLGSSISVYSICTSGTIKALMKKYEKTYGAENQ